MHRLAGWGLSLTFLALPIIWKRWRSFKLENEESKQRQAALRSRCKQISNQRSVLEAEIRSEEGDIQQISQEYGLSKRFLATLDMKEALEITQETLARQMPHLKEEERTWVLQKIQSWVEQGEVSAQALIEGVPASRTDVHARERWWDVSGQLALGLQRVGLYRQVQESAIHDGLTGLLVRRHFRERLEEEAARSLRRKSSLAFLMVDLDHFKSVNDSFGHLVGDVVLREVAKLIQKSVREIDLLGRFGGEEFSVALPETDRLLALAVSDRIRQEIGAAVIRAYDEEVRVTVSIGVAVFPTDAGTANQLIEKADQAMYQAKAKGRNQSVAIQP